MSVIKKNSDIFEDKPLLNLIIKEQATVRAFSVKTVACFVQNFEMLGSLSQMTHYLIGVIGIINSSFLCYKSFVA